MKNTYLITEKGRTLVKADAKKMKTMLEYSDGIRKVPVIVEQGNVTIGFNGGT